MKKFLAITLVLILGGAGFSLKDFIIPQTWKYKITIEVDTPEGVKSGSAVRHIKARRELAGFIGQGIITYETIGEAVVVDLGERGVLFGLIEDTDYLLLENAFERPLHDAKEHMYYFANLPLGTQQTLGTNLPPFITFLDLGDPTSSKGVKQRKMSEIFGPDVNLNKVTIEIVDAPTTKGRIRKYLKWYDSKQSTLNYEARKKIWKIKEHLIKGE